ncbi:MAG: regulatory protein RecX [Nitrospirota bacterium]|nr:regulatory protein RecX [Nitrospirota bacterium]
MKISNNKSKGQRAASRSSDSTSSARGYALRLLSIRGRSERELRDRLRRKGFKEDTIDTTVSALKEFGLIDDPALADDLISYAVNRKSLGTRGVRALLQKRGIPEDIINSSGIDTIDETKSAEELVRKKVKLFKGLPKEKVMRRLYGMLQRRGHSFETIKRVLDGERKNLE